ncbi:imidazolonepropionase-like amidohydrolase [Altererythrobacter atlanticus]|uniref:Imidazolonepropionase n=1 Tax=Croceibacterium atlanticum TaxID=1267766 RepID=A0A0F7KQX7_9SPHN|nr:amidohydrolase family protein [Croceibacterium atlanticum]AKH41974.1 imidazolonepropionase [Croceibacterium atlanticum]MBB5733458.1 imidazolonepropionase-like amidohydrolase [Croceibacterium atlanticum]
MARHLIATALTCCAALASGPAFAAQSLVLDHVRMVDLAGQEPAIGSDRTLVITDGHIVYAGDADRAPSPEDARRIDASGLTLMPGLVDMHVHVWDEAALGAYLAHGVTTIRNMSGMPFHLDMQRRIESGELAGPRLMTTGPILNSAGPNAQINHQLVEDAASAREAVRWQHEAGFRHLKLYSNLRRDAFHAVVDQAGKLGMTMTGHTPEGERLAGIPAERDFVIPFDEVLAAGFTTIEHNESILWHGLHDRQDPVGARELAGRIAAAGVPVTPTLVAYRNLIHVAETNGAYAQRPGTEWMNPVLRPIEADNVASWAMRDAAPYADSIRFLGTMAAMMQDAGVMLVTGSDAGIFVNPPGLSLIDEMTLLAEAGLTPAQVLKAATANPAIVLGEAGLAGCLEEGCRADLVLYDCDPLAEIACTAKPQAVIRNGEYLDRAALDAMLDAATRQDPQRTMRNLAEGMTAQGSELPPGF